MMVRLLSKGWKAQPLVTLWSVEVLKFTTF